jgi:uncharacterized membrane protein
MDLEYFLEDNKYYVLAGLVVLLLVALVYVGSRFWPTGIAG